LPSRILSQRGERGERGERGDKGDRGERGGAGNSGGGGKGRERLVVGTAEGVGEVGGGEGGGRGVRGIDDLRSGGGVGPEGNDRDENLTRGSSLRLNIPRPVQTR